MSSSRIVGAIRSQRLRRTGPFRHSQRAIFSTAQTEFRSIGRENLYVVNYRDNKMLKIDSQGAVALFTTISAKGLGHLCFNQKDRFYVTASQSHEIYEVMLDGTASRILGNGERGIVDGADKKARLSFPNGIVKHPWSQRLYIDEFVNETPSSLPRRAIVREIILAADQP